MTIQLTDEQLRQFALDVQAEAYAAGYRQAANEREDVWFKPSEAAKRLNLKSPSAIYRLISNGQLPATKFSDELRISAADLRAFMVSAQSAPLAAKRAA